MEAHKIQTNMKEWKIVMWKMILPNLVKDQQHTCNAAHCPTKYILDVCILHLDKGENGYKLHGMHITKEMHLMWHG